MSAGGPTSGTASSSVPLDGLIAYLDGSPSPYHAVANAAARLDGAGFTRVELAEPWESVRRVESVESAYVVRGGALVAWRRSADAPPSAPWRIVGAHTDSPNLRLKPNPDTGAAGWRQLAVEVYGGALVNSWLDRDLGVSGRVVLADGSVRLVKVDRPLARVAQLAIHLDRDVNERGLVLDKQAHLTPLWGLGAPVVGQFNRWLADTLALATPHEVRAFDVMFHDLTPARVLGVDGELLASARLDNLCSSWAAIDALVAVPVQDDLVAAACLFDHEEVGSDSTTGAGGPMLAHVVERVIASAGGSVDDRYRAVAASICVSADMAHAIHPNYPERHEPGHRPLPNGGPVLKINASQRYATDAVSAAHLVACCERAGVPHQEFVSRNNMPCGSTIGPITAARLGITTVDVGIAQLSMHSARELCGAADPPMLARMLAEHYTAV